MSVLKAKVISISLPPDMTDEVQEIAREERRSVSEVLREAFRQYAAQRTLKGIRKEARKAVKKLKIKPDDIDDIIHKARRE